MKHQSYGWAPGNIQDCGTTSKMVTGAGEGIKDFLGKWGGGFDYGRILMK
ncbi:MAG: hypothetical protein AB7P49_16865 [Bdellovibrionales bacterium]